MSNRNLRAVPGNRPHLQPRSAVAGNGVLIWGLFSMIGMVLAGIGLGSFVASSPDGFANWPGRGAGAEFSAYSRFTSLAMDAARTPSSFAGDACAECDQLDAQIEKVNSLPVSATMTRGRAKAEMRETAALGAGEQIMLRVLANPKVSADKKWETIAKFLAKTAARDGTQFALNNLLEDLQEQKPPLSEKAVLGRVMAAAKKLYDSAILSKVEYELLQQSVDVVSAGPQD